MSEAGDPERDRRFRRHFVRLWLGQVLSGIGDQLHHVALIWIAVEAVGEQAGWVMAAGAVARLVFGLVGGVYADRWDRQRTLIGCDLLGAAAVATLVFADPDSRFILFHLAVVATWLGALDSLFQPALQASLPAIAPDAARLQTANAWIDVTRRLALTLGPTATGLLLSVMPLQMFFAVDAATFATSALFIASLGRGYVWKPAKSEAASARPGVWNEIAAAAGLVRQDARLMIALAQHVVWNFTLGAALTLGIAMIVNGEGLGGPALLGYATGAYGIGNVASNLVLASRPVKNTTRMLHLGALVAALGWLASSAIFDVPIWLFAIACTAIGGPMTDLMLLRLIQTGYPPDQIGKVFSFRFTVSRAAGGLGLMLAPAVYGALGARAGIALGAVILGLVALYGLATSGRREREALAQAAPTNGSSISSTSNRRSR